MASRTTKKTGTRKKSKGKDTKSTLQAKKQMWAVVLFAVGLLVGALTIIEGGKLWKSLHNILFGFFGWSVYFLAPLMIYIAVIAAMDKPLSAIKAKLWQVMVLIVMISGAIQIFGPGLPDQGNLAENIVALWESGKNLQGGGLAGAIFAVPLIALLDTTGGKIIIILAIFVFVMLITGSTLISLYHLARRPVKGIEEAYAEAVETRNERTENAPPPPPGKPARGAKKQKAAETPRFDIDVDISGDSDPAEFSPEHMTVGVEHIPPAKGKGKTQAAPAAVFPDQDMPGHPVISRPAEEDGAAKPPWVFSMDNLSMDKLSMDSPVEFISAEEFMPKPEPLPEPEPEPSATAVPPLAAGRAHPLDDEITLAEVTAEDNSEIEDIIGRFITGDHSGTVETTVIDTRPPHPGEGGFDDPVVVLPQEIDGPAFTLNMEGPSVAEPVEYKHPPIGLLAPAKAASSEDITEELKNNAQNLVDTLKSFGVQTRITDICRGPAVTRYELQPSAGVKISKITGLSDDIALNLASAGIRIEAPIPNKAAVGIEVPNKVISMVSIREIIDSHEFVNAESSLSVALGKDIAGAITLADLGKMPHVLIAGSTGSGKSVCINSIIVSLLYKSSPDEVKLLMVDPKVVELGIYNGIPHLLVPVVTDPKKAAGALGWAVTEMLNRYKSFADNSVRDLAGYNRLAAQNPELSPMPKIVIIIDELADLMMAAPGDVEDSICRLAQMARAAGMHLVIATQRPSVDVITGVIKANIPSRIAFAVSSMVDSRTILDMGGAEKLLGRGDMLFYPVGAQKPVRVQGCFVTDTEVEKVVEFVKAGDTATYDQAIVEEIDRHVVVDKKGKGSGGDDGGGFDDEDEMLPQAIECVIEMGQASTSSLQRRLKLGYARAARIIDQLEQKGIVGPFEGSKPRQVLISKDRWMEMKLSGNEESLLKDSAATAEGINRP